MFGTIRKHSSSLWLVVITLTVISFVWWGTGSGGGGRPTDAELGTINGRPVSQDDINAASRDVAIQFGSEQQARARGINQNDAIREQLVIRAVIAENGIVVGEKAIAEAVKAMPTFRDRETGQFRKDQYDGFLKRLAQEQRIGEVDFLEFMRTQLGIQQLQAVYGQPGRLATPSEAEELYRQENEQFTTELVAFNAFDFVGKVNTSSSNLSQFYSNRMGTYRIGERLVVNFVKFEFSNYLAQAETELAKMTNLVQQVDAAYNQRGPAAFTGTNGQPLTLDQARVEIRAGFKSQLAALNARKAANAFATEVLGQPKVTAETLTEVAGKKGLQIFESKPFTMSDMPPGLNVMENFARVAFAITTEAPVPAPLEGVDAYFVIAQKQKIDSEIPKLESILQKVMDDYRSEESAKLAVAAGEAFGTKVADGLNAGKTFEKLCAEGKVTARSLSPFSISTRQLEGLDNTVSLFDLQNVAQSLNPGQASKFSPTRDGGFVIYVKSKLPANEDKLKAELPAYLEQLRQQRQGRAFQEWFSRTLQSARLTGRIATLGGSTAN